MNEQPSSSNLQGLENKKPLLRGDAHETISFDPHQVVSDREHHSTGKVVREQSDIYRLQDEDFRARVQQIATGEPHVTDNAADQPSSSSVREDDPVVHPDGKLGRLRLSIRYDQEHSQMAVQITDAQGIIRPEQQYAPEMHLSFSLLGADTAEHKREQHARVVVENAAVAWKEPMTFAGAHEQLGERILHIMATNHTDPSAPRDREVFISLKGLKQDGTESHQWFTLQPVEST